MPREYPCSVRWAAGAGLAAFLLSACATPPRTGVASPEHVPYFRQEGIASWYGPGFHGRKTASGERFNQGDLTCAHRKLPFGTRLKVTNLKNGQELIVTVNDRGPYVKPRILDLSREAAHQLDFLHLGTTRVLVETLPPEGVLDALGTVAEVDTE